MAGTAAGTGVDLAKLGAGVLAIGAVGDDLLADMLTGEMAGTASTPAAWCARTGPRPRPRSCRSGRNGERPALHVPGATALLDRGDIDLAGLSGIRALLVGAPDALGGLVEDGLADVVSAAKASGALVAVDVLRPGSPRDFERIAGLLARRTGSRRTPISWPHSPARTISSPPSTRCCRWAPAASR